mmetsp:Transcript_9395/g.11504  ORF Transcript_9395/g.11504 Transcript_9395/m.11504 type:complete len:95 (+) Transcript_9395:64-348(+)
MSNITKQRAQRPQTAKTGAGSKTRTKPSADIDVNDVMSRFGRGTTHYFISISNVLKQRERKAMGGDANAGGKPRPKEVVPGLRALRQKRAFMIN